MTPEAAAPADQALILFAHGSRDPQWAETFQRMAQALRERLPSDRRASVQLAFLELMTPDLAAATAQAIAQGARRVAIAPLFLGAGSHIREDLPRLLEALRQQHPDVAIDLLPLLGDMPELVQAVADIYAPRCSDGTADPAGERRN